MYIFIYIHSCEDIFSVLTSYEDIYIITTVLLYYHSLSGQEVF